MKDVRAFQLLLVTQLRKADVPLGLEEVSELIAVLGAPPAGFGTRTSGFGLADPLLAFKALCVLMLAKSRDDQVHIELILDDVLQQWGQQQTVVTTPEPVQALQQSHAATTVPTDEALSMPARQHTIRRPAVQALPPPPVPLGVAPDLAFRDTRGAVEAYPITQRQMRQAWRRFRRSARSGPPIELDIEATLDRVTRIGFLDAPVLVPRRINQASALLLVDREGSMVPFHGMARLLVAAAQHDARMRLALPLYFHDVPGDNLYRDPGMLNAVDTRALLEGRQPGLAVNARTALVVISDAGAARGRLDAARVAATRDFVARAQASGLRRLIWLNPLPAERWVGSSAAAIDALLPVPMLELSRAGMKLAMARLHSQDGALGVQR